MKKYLIGGVIMLFIMFAIIATLGAVSMSAYRVSVDNTLNIFSRVHEVPPEENTPGEEAQSGYTLEDSEGN